MNCVARELGTLAGGGAFFEGPRWHEGRLWVSGFWLHHVQAISMDGTSGVKTEEHVSASGKAWVVMRDPEGNEFCLVRVARV